MAFSDRVRAAMKAQAAVDNAEPISRPPGSRQDEDFDMTGLRVARGGDGNLYVVDPQTGEQVDEVVFTDVVQHQGAPTGAKLRRDTLGRVRSVKSVDRDAFGRSRRKR